MPSARNLFTRAIRSKKVKRNAGDETEETGYPRANRLSFSPQATQSLTDIAGKQSLRASSTPRFNQTILEPTPNDEWTHTLQSSRSSTTGQFTSSDERPKTLLNANEMRKTRFNEQITLLTNELSTFVCELISTEHKVQSKSQLIGIWNPGYIHDGTAGEDSIPMVDAIKVAIDNFMKTLPSRYALGIDSPAEVMAHMRFIGIVKKNPAKSAVHISRKDSIPMQLTFYTGASGMSNLKLITITCVHTIGLLNLVTGFLVTGGSEILDCNYLLSSDKIMLIRCIVNMKGPERLETLESNIDDFVRASRGLPTSSDALQILVPTTIGAIDNDGVWDTLMMPSKEEQVDMTFSEKDGEALDPPIPLYEIAGEDKDSAHNGKSRTKHRKRLFRRAASSNLGLTLDKSSDDEGEQPFFQNCSLIDHGYFGNIVLTGILKPNYSGVSVYRGRLEDEFIGNNHPAFIAIKIAICRTESDLEVIQELGSEAAVAHGLEHPNICKLLDALITPNFSCLSYEYCSKGSLSSLLADRSMPYDVLDLALDISKGMAYLHSKNIIHRDLKPSNIFLTHDCRAKIADFGLSITDTGGEEFTGETGTYRWMAPEIIRHEKYSINSDTYSFGIILWQLVTRNPRPFADLQPIQTAFAVANGQRPEIPDDIPEHVSRIIKVCWHRDQLCRPSFANVSISLSQFGTIADDIKIRASIISS